MFALLTWSRTWKRVFLIAVNSKVDSLPDRHIEG